MALLCSLILTSAWVVGREALSVLDCGAFARRPEYTDISVGCGTSAIELAVQICPVLHVGYNVSLLILNRVGDDANCRGTLDISVAPPVVRFIFPIGEGNACGSNFMTTSTPGTGIFSDFSNIQSVNISGMVRSHDPTIGTITYNTELKYYYSCAYPLEYLVNNTQVDASSSSVAVTDKNGSFISTLSMALYQDVNYTTPLIMPPLGIELRTNIYVQVAASNLTSQYFVLLDRCYTSMNTHSSNSTFFNLFVPCSIDQLTTMLENGESQKARFYFPAFRFIQQQNRTVSTYYLHCIIRLCKPSTCSTFKQCNRKWRSVETTGVPKEFSDTSVLTVPIKAKTDMSSLSKEQALSGDQSSSKAASVGLGIVAGVLIVVGVAAILIAASFYRKLKRLS